MRAELEALKLKRGAAALEDSPAAASPTGRPSPPQAAPLATPLAAPLAALPVTYKADFLSGTGGLDRDRDSVVSRDQRSASSQQQ